MLSDREPPTPDGAPTPVVRRGTALSRIDLRAVGPWLLSFSLVTFLALHGGGYDIVPRSQAGLTIWWLILIGAIAGVLPARVARGGWIAIGLLSAFAAWSALAISWSQSSEQSVIETGRICTYLGALVLVVLVQGRSPVRHTLNGLTCAVGVVTVLALLSRLHPQAFGADPHLAFLNPVSIRKLSYPLGYWNALADFIAMGIPLLLTAATSGRTLAGRALAAAILPLAVACVYLTISRGGAIAVGLGVVVLLALVPRRLEITVTVLVAAGASAVLIHAIAARHALTGGVPTPAAIHQGTLTLWLSLGLAVGVGLAQLLIARLADRPRRPRILAPGRRTTAKLALAAGTVALVTALAVGAPSRLDRAWHDFQQPTGVVAPGNDSTVFSRLQAANGNNRYQFWQAALDANATDPWRGIGPGTFQFWWTAHPTATGFVRNAHSLYFETLAETGIPGLVLLGGLLAWCTVVAAVRAFTEPTAVRVWLAGASAAFVVFLVSAALEWVWQIAAVAVAALVLVAVIVAGAEDAPDTARSQSPQRSPTPPRSRAVVSIGLGVAAAVALAAVAVPFAEQLAVRSSQSAAAGGRLGAALGDANAAARLAPWSSSAHLQQALVLEAAGQLGRASVAARAASIDSPTDWTTWLTRARIDARRGEVAASLSELRRARALNPHSPLFARG